MSEILVFLSGILGGVIAWVPFGTALAASRYKLGGAVIRSNNKWIHLAVQPTESFTIPGQMLFLLTMLAWLCIFFGAMALPGIVARVVDVPLTSPSLKYGIYANFVVAVIAFLTGPAIWRKLALLR